MIISIRKSILCLTLFLCVIFTSTFSVFAQVNTNQNEHFIAFESRQVICRIFYQDHKTKELMWFNFYHGVPYKYSAPKKVEGFPKLDSSKQNLVQMASCKGTLLVGIQDNDSGNFNSGWVLVSTGVREVPHGNHSHWYYDQEPKVLHKDLSKAQGNPEHVYVYGNVYYVANNHKNGFTRIDPLDSATNTSSKPVVGFHSGGGNHITFAVDKNQVGYSTWIDKQGDNKGRVDVTKIASNGNKQISHSFKLPTGGIHGSAVSNGKVLFATEDGINWLAANSASRQNQTDLKVNHVSLGNDPESKEPLRTDAFTADQNHVLFVKGKNDFAELCILNTSLQKPKLTTVPFKMEKGAFPTPPVVVKSRWNQRLAFLFHNHEKELELQDYMSVFDLDPNGDMNFEDATLIKTMEVGGSSVENNFGHNGISFDHACRFAFWTNPEDGTIYVLSLRTLKYVTHFKVDGMPTKIHVNGERDVWAH